MRELPIAIIFLFVSMSITAQTGDTLSSTLSLDEFTITSLGGSKPLESIPYPISLIKPETQTNIQFNSTADLIATAPGLSLMRDAIWASSVSLRGLSDQRLVTLIDGNRIETATEIDGYLSMLDLNDIEKIEIIKGGVSSLYGSGALGGVLNIVTKKGTYSSDFKTRGNLSTGFHGVNHLFESGAGLSISNRSYHIKASGSFRTANNASTPKGELANSAFNDYSLSLKGGIRVNDNQELQFNAQHFSGWDIGFPGGSAFPGPATVVFPEHNRDLMALEYHINDIGDHWLKSTVKTYYQYILRDVFVTVQQPTQSLNITPQGIHHTYGANFSNELAFGKHAIFTGLDFWSRKANSTREKIITKDDGNIIVRGEKPLPDASQSNLGIFIQDEIEIIDQHLNASIGIRFDINNTLNDAASDPAYVTLNGNAIPFSQRTTFEANNIWTSSYGANAGLHYSPVQQHHFTMTLGRSFRAASIEEKFKYIDLGSAVHIGDPKLSPETALSADIGYKLKGRILSASLNFFYNHINNMIVEVPGSVTLPQIDGTAETVTLDAFIGRNVDQAILKGFDGEFTLSPVKYLKVQGSVSYVLGTNETVKSDPPLYLPLIPPFNASLGFSFMNKFVVPEVRINYAAEQTKVALGETSTEAYQLIDFSLNSAPFTLSNLSIKITAGVQNVGNTAYVNHLASNRGLVKYEPGRNYFVKLRMMF